GRKLWSRDCASWGWGIEPDLFATDGLVWVWGRGESPLLGLDPDTGEVVRKRPEFRTFGINHHHRCYRNKATSRFMLTSWRGLECIPWKESGDGSYTHWWFRAGCRHGFVPSNGLIYNSPNPCVCYLDAKLGGINALAPSRPAPDGHTSVPDAARLQKGDAYPASPEPPDEDAESWPAYRHDIYRSSSTPSASPAAPEKEWSARLGSQPTPAVTGGDRVYVSVPEKLVVRAFDAEQGGRLWSFTPGARVYTPPTYYRGYLVFGSADGYVYCLRADDGRLAWKFLAARGRRRVMKEGRLESAWPVHSSVIVQDGRAYVTAGRSTFLDGGVQGWVLDVKTGEILDRRRWDTTDIEPDDEGVTVRRKASRPGFASDIPVSDGSSIYVKDRGLFENVLQDGPERPLIRPRSSFLDATWYNRASQWRVGGELHGEQVAVGPDRVFAFAAYDTAEGRSTNDSYIMPGTGAFRLYSRPLSGKESANHSGWARDIRIGVKAMAAASSHLVVGGWPDRVPEDDPWKYIEGRGSGRLLVLSTEDGETRSELQLPAPPVLDGIAVSAGRIYVSTQDGRLLCLGEE
ncbi:MAG: PQQ-binding-like beta-propeller repeat protein, partial [Planctomycetota bacterium]